MSEIEEASNWEIASTKKMISHSFGFVIFSYLNSVFALSVFYFYEVEIGLLDKQKEIKSKLRERGL